MKIRRNTQDFLQERHRHSWEGFRQYRQLDTNVR